MNAFAADPNILSSNNGAATFLTIDPDTGLSEYMICGKAYVVHDDGRTPLSKGQVWALQEMVNCAMDIYDMDPSNMVAGKEFLQEWTNKYKQKTWTPRSGLGGMNIYNDRQPAP